LQGAARGRILRRAAARGVRQDLQAAPARSLLGRRGATDLSPPPFRAEHIGSLLRPAALLEARERFARGEIDPATLTAAEERAIEDAVRLQQRVGLRLATDGEFRRHSYHSYFYGQLGDISFQAPPGEAGRRGARARG